MELSRLLGMAEAKVAGACAMKIRSVTIPVGELGTFRVAIPITQIGTGKSPHLGILCGVHGDETSSLLISYLLLKRLSTQKLHGTISILTASNPIAQAINSRVSVTDFFDLNRTGTGKQDGVLTERLAYKIVEYLSGHCSHVIDLHEFEMNTPPMAIYIPAQDELVDKQILRMIRVFNPVTVWSMNLAAPDELQYKGSLLSVLITKGIPGFAVETSRLCLVTQEEIERVVQGIVDICKLTGIIAGEYKYFRPTPYKRHVKYSDYAGLWLPQKETLCRIKQGEKVGKIIGLDLVSEYDVHAWIDGTLIQIRKPALVQTGMNLYTIGEIDYSVVQKFDSIEG